MNQCKEVFEKLYRVPAGVIYLRGNYVNVVPQAKERARKTNQRFDVFRNGYKRGYELNLKEYLEQMKKETEELL